MRRVIILFTVIFSLTVNVNSEEKVLPDDCFEVYKISPHTLGCNLKKGIKKMITKKDGSHNFLGKFFNAKTHKDLFK